MTSMCDHANFCGKRMTQGTRAGGCGRDDQKACNPTIGQAPTAPEPHGRAPHMACTKCQRTASRSYWMPIAARMETPTCACGSSSWSPL